MIDRNLYPDEEILNTKEVAAAIGYNRRTVVAWVTNGILPATRRPGTRGHYRIRWADVYELLHRPAEVKPKKPKKKAS